MREELASIERQLRRFAEERAEAEAGAALQAKLRAQAAAASLPAEQRQSVDEALEAVRLRLEAYMAVQAERQQTVTHLATRISLLRGTHEEAGMS